VWSILSASLLSVVMEGIQIMKYNL
jgi:hypothetical protein